MRQEESLEFEGRGACSSMFSLSMGKKGASFYSHVTFITISGGLCKEIKNIINKNKSAVSGEAWRSTRGKNTKESKDLSSAKKE